MTAPAQSCRRFAGVFASLPTHFNADLSLEEKGLREHCEYLITSPFDVVVALGTEGEFCALTDAEPAA